MFANNTGADRPAHPRSLISIFVIHFLEIIICKRATGGISIFYIIFVAEGTSLKLSLAETPETGFLATRPKLINRLSFPTPKHIHEMGFEMHVMGHSSVYT